MPIEVGIWRIGSNIERVHFSSIETEAKLEDVLHRDISVLDPSLMVVGRQVSTIYGKYIDLLAIDADGDLTVVELKRNKTPREVVAQTLDYASWVQTLTHTDITALFAEQHPNERFEEAFSSRFGISPPETLNENHNLVVVASELDNSTERIISYLADFEVPINVVFFRYLQRGHERIHRPDVAPRPQASPRHRFVRQACLKVLRSRGTAQTITSRWVKANIGTGKIAANTASSLPEEVSGIVQHSNSQSGSTYFCACSPTRICWRR